METQNFTDSKEGANNSLLRLKQEAFNQISVLENFTKTMKRKNKIYNVINYASIAASLALDFAPAFITSLQSNWYSIPTVSFSLITLLLNIHLDKESYSTNIRENNIFKAQLEEIIDSINRKNRKRLERGGEESEDYIKRLQSKLSSIKLARNL